MEINHRKRRRKNMESSNFVVLEKMDNALGEVEEIGAAVRDIS